MNNTVGSTRSPLVSPQSNALQSWPALPNNRKLAEDLGMTKNSKLPKDFKKKIHKITDENIDFSRTFVEHDAAQIAAVEERITQSCPELFGDPALDKATQQKRMKAAMFLVKKRIYMVRFTNKRSSDGSPQQPTPSATPSPLSGVTKRTVKSPKTVRSSKTKARKPPSTPRNPRASRGSAVSDPLSTPAPSYESDISNLPSYYSGAPSIPPTPNNDFSSMHPDSTFPLSTNRRPPPTPTATSPTSQSTLLACRGHEVEEFLVACNPSMVSHLNSFLAFGCYNRNFLAAVASWSDHEIEDFLRVVIFKEPEADQVSDGGEIGIAAMITNMELFILRRHFRAYFAVGVGYD